MNSMHEADTTESANNATVAEGGSGSTTSTTSATSATAAVGGAGTKALVRKIVAIDLDKLRQTGLDRKIAVALGRRQKLSTAAAAAGRLPTMPMTTLTTKTTATAAVSTIPPTRPNTVPKKMVPPKITITRPLESPPIPITPTQTNLPQTDEEYKYNVQLSTANERLVHAKSVLKQNLMMKARARNAKALNTTTTSSSSSSPTQTTTTNTDSIGLNLTENSATSNNPNESSSFSPSSGAKVNNALSLKKSRATYVDRPKKVVLQSLKPPPTIVRKPSPIKTPQEIARVLDFSSSCNEALPNSAPKGPPLVLNYTLPKPPNQIPYSTASATPSNLSNRNNPMPATATFQDSFKKQLKASSVKMKPTGYQHLPKTKTITPSLQETGTGHAQVDDNDIPKASIKATAKRSTLIRECNSKSTVLSAVDNTALYTPAMPLNKIPSSTRNMCEMPIDFPEVSPLKQPFPSTSLPGESPLPTISTFKKPFATAMQPPVTVKLESNEYFVQPSYFAMPSYQMNTATAEPFNFVKPNPSFTTSSANSLIVLEHKVLSHDEKIDLTALRLAHSTPTLSTPSSPVFTTTLHSGIATDISGSGIGEIVIKQEKELEEFVPESSPAQFKPNSITIKSFKQPRKVIQAADKLKLPPEKIAALARQIQTQTLGKLKKQSGTILRIPTKHSVMDKLAKVRLMKSTQQLKPLTNIADEVSLNQQTILKEELVQSVKVENLENTTSENFTNSIAISTPTSNSTTMTVGQQFSLMPQAMEIEPTSPSSDLSNEFTRETKPSVSNQQNTSSETFTKTEPTEFSRICKSALILTKRETDELSSPNCDFNFQAHQFTYPSATAKASVEIMKEPLNYNSASISAVDFIASLTSSHPITEETTLELSPEELNLNASFAMNLSPIRIPYYNRKESQLTKKEHNSELLPPGEHYMNEETVARVATEDTFLSNEDEDNASEFGVEIGNIVTIENDNNVSQLSPNSEGIIKIPSIDGVKKERDIIIASIANESLQKVTDINLAPTNIESENISEDFNQNVQKVNNTENNTENPTTISKEEDVLQANEVPVVVANESISESIPTINTSPKTRNEQSNNNEFKEQSSINVKADINEENSIIEPIKLYDENCLEVKTSMNASTSKSVDLIESAQIEEIEDANTPETEEIITANFIKDNELQKLSELLIATEDAVVKVQVTNKNFPLETKETNSFKIPLKTSEDVVLKENTNSNDITTSAPSQIAATSKKRISRFKKGTINLVQRKKSTASNTQSKTEVSNEIAKIEPNKEEASTIETKDAFYNEFSNELAKIQLSKENPCTIETTDVFSNEVSNEIAKIQPNKEESSTIETKDDFCNENSNISPKNLPTAVFPELEEIPKIPTSEPTEYIQLNKEEQSLINVKADVNKEDSNNESIKLPIENRLDVKTPIKSSTESEVLINGTEIFAIDEALDDKAIKKDISQLVNPPPMPKKKRALKEDITQKIVDEAESASHSNAVSLLEVIKMSENPESLLPAQVPFKPKSLELEPSDNQEQPIGIKSLLTQLESGKLIASNVVNKTDISFAEDREADALNDECDETKIMLDETETNVISEQHTSLQFDTVKLSELKNIQVTGNNMNSKSVRNDKNILDIASQRNEKVADAVDQHPSLEKVDIAGALSEEEMKCSKSSIVGEGLILSNKTTSIQSHSDSESLSQVKKGDEQEIRNAITEEDEQETANDVTEQEQVAKNDVLTRPTTKESVNYIQSHSDIESLIQAKKGNEQETKNAVTEEKEQEAANVAKPTNKESVNSNKDLKTPPKALYCKEEFEFLPLTPPIKKLSDLSAETKKLKYPSQSSEDAEIGSTQSYHDFDDDDEEIAATAEESSQELVTMKTIQRKRLRKCNIKKRKRPFDTDSEDDRDDDINEVDAQCHSMPANEFRGFDETSPTNSKMQKSLDFIIAATSAEDDTDDEADPMRGRKKDCKTEIATSSDTVTAVADGDTTTMKNWLTTGKAIAPTSFYSGKKVRQRVSTIRTSERIGSSTNMPLKKRWESQYEDTDITDDTSPADDDNDEQVVDDNDEEDKFQKLLRANSVITGERSLRLLEPEEAKIIASKKLKLPEVLKRTNENCGLNKRENDTDNEVTSFLKPLPITPPHEVEAAALLKDEAPLIVVTKKRVGRKPKKFKILEPLETEGNKCIDSTPMDDEESFTTKPNNDTLLNRMEVDKVTETVKMETSPMTTSTSNIPKKRGRKSRIESAEETSTMESEATTTKPSEPIYLENTATLPKKRGRKPKAKVDIVAEFNSSTESESKSNNGVTERISIIETLETKTAETTSPLTDTIESENMAAVPKKRGRKPKASTNSNVDECNTTISTTMAATEHKSIIEYFERTIATPEPQSVEVTMLPENSLACNETEMTPNIPKKRGRKPKTIRVEVATTSTPKQTVEEMLPELEQSLHMPIINLDLGELQTTASIPRKRERGVQSDKKGTSETTQDQAESIINENSTPIAPKKRGRKPKIKVEDDGNATISATTTDSEAPKQKSIIEYFEAHDGPKSTTPTISEASIATDSPMPKKRGRKPKAMTIPSTASSEGQADASSAAVTSTAVADNNSEVQNFNARLLLIRNRAELDSEEVLTNASAGTGPLQCGLCLVRTTRAKWTQHLAEHYGVGWVVGEPELNLRMRSFVLTIMINFYKETQIKGLACRMCARMYRSGLGLLSHVETCGVPRTMISCEYCNREYQSHWIGSHQRTCAANKGAEEDAEVTTSKLESKKIAAVIVPNVLNNVGRVKRASLMKAESKLKAIGEEMVSAAAAESQQFEPKNHIKYHAALAMDEIRNEWTNSLKNFGKAFCPQKACRFYLEAAFNADILTALDEHLGTCKQIPKPGYHCLKCRNKIFKLEADAIKHVAQTHKPQTGSDFEADSSDCDVKLDDDSIGDNDDDDEESSGEDEEEDVLNSNDETITDTATTSTPGSKRRRRPATAGCVKKSPRTKKAKIQRPQTFQSNYKPLYPRRSDNCSRLTANKWKEFCATNLSNTLLYTYATPTFNISTVNLDAERSQANADIDALKACLPSQRVSMKYAFAAKPKFQKELGAPDTTIEWSELKRFESATMQADQFVFLGAPVKTLVWVPLPSHVREQYLAVSYRKDIDKYTRLQNPKIAPAFILVYKVTTTSEDAVHVQPPQLQYAIRIPDGPVQCLAFLPSGGYDDATNRLGLLAVGTAVGATINIYALPLSVQPQGKENKFSDNKLHVLELKPALVLRLDMELMADAAAPAHSLTQTQCLQICWSESLSHRHIFASYSNGCVGIWDTSTDNENTNLNCFIIENLHHFVPLNLFYVGEKIIRALAIHYDSAGPRWLAAACHSRKFVVYDIRDLTQPLAVKEENSKNIIRSMDWSALWETPVIGFCDIVPKDGRAVTVISLTGVIFNRNKLDNMLSAVAQIHYNPALNIHVCATDNGDVIFLNGREIHRDDVFPRSQKNCRAIAMMDIKCLDGAPLPQCKSSSRMATQCSGEDIADEEDEAVDNRTAAVEQDCKQRFGLVFGDVIKYKLENKNNYLSAQRIPPSSVDSYMRVNSLRCNLNAPSRRLVAVGYENGFLRIMRFNPNKFFNDTS